MVLIHISCVVVTSHEVGCSLFINNTNVTMSAPPPEMKGEDEDPGEVKEYGESDNDTSMTQEEMIEKLMASGKYTVQPKLEFIEHGTSTPDPSKGFMRGMSRGRGILGYSFGRGYGIGHTKSSTPGTDQTFTGLKSLPPIPKVPQFSGDDPPQKGDVSYPEWQFEIRCLRNDPEVSSSQLVQAIPRSLRGTARKMLIPLGEKATVDDILTKLDALFADISTNGMSMQEFFNSFQRLLDVG